MLECTIENGKTKILASGSLTDICSDITCLFRGIIEGIDNEESVEAFKFMFTKGFNDGVIFGVSREEMQEIRKTVEEYYEEHEEHDNDLKHLQTLTEILSTINKLLKDEGKNKKDETK